MPFVHLHVHSHYSPLQAAGTAEAYAERCAKLKMPAMALTDYGNMFGALEFYFQAREKGVKPIIGCDMHYVEDISKKESQTAAFRDSQRHARSLVLLAKNMEGYRNLCRISSLGYQKGFYFVPRSDYKTLERHKEGLFALTGGHRGRAFTLFRSRGRDAAAKEIKTLKSIFGSSLYLELLPPALPQGQAYNSFLLEMSESLGAPLVAANDVHYVEKGDSLVQDVLSCIGMSRTLNDRERPKLGPPEFYLKSEAEMEALFAAENSAAHKQALAAAGGLAESCAIEFKIKDSRGKPIYHLPQSAGRSNQTESLKSLSEKGLQKRFRELEGLGESFSPERKALYSQRLGSELRIIGEMGFTGYFLIVHDFIHWAKNQGIPVGPGRGSGASSLVSFCLEITDIDPMPLGLIFERFLNPERISMPDFDIDFCQENRHRVISYINEKYGSDCVSHVVTYGRLKVRGGVRDVGRVLGWSYGDTDKVARLIPSILDVTLKEALKKEPRLKALSDEDPQVAQLLKITGMLEGLIRHVGIHAAGIIISDTPIINYAPLYRGSEGENAIQYDLKRAEQIGLVKFDFLGLKTLTHIAEAFRLIERTKGEKLSPRAISLKDQGIYEVMRSGDTVGIFQFESQGISDLLIKSQPTCFEDIVAINALYSPGPMSMIPSYLDRKKGRAPVEYIFPELEPVLKDTYGVIIYQEQVQQIAVTIAGYSYGEADVLRRAMGKKIRSAMARQKKRFLEGAAQKGFDLKKSEKLFDLMAEFAKYGFNKSHAAAYCVLAAQTAWLKHYHKIEFFAAQMTIDQNDSGKLANYIRDARRHGIGISPPHVNSSESRFSIKKGRIQFSMRALKGVGKQAAQSIEKARAKLPKKKFSSIEDFFESADLRLVNKKTLESLIKAGAFDGFGRRRREIFEGIDKFAGSAAQKKRERETGQQSLFGGASMEKAGHVELPALEPWPQKQRLLYEKEIFGFYLNSHPIKFLQPLRESFGLMSLKDLEGLSESPAPAAAPLRPAAQGGKPSRLLEKAPAAKVLAMAQSVRIITTKKDKKRMAFVMLEDDSGSIEAVFFPEIYEKAMPFLEAEGEIAILEGSVQKKDKTRQLVPETIQLLDDFLAEIKAVQMDLPSDMARGDLARLRRLLEEGGPGASHLFLRSYLPSAKALVEFDTGGLPDVKVTRGFLERAGSLLSKGGARGRIHLS